MPGLFVDRLSNRAQDFQRRQVPYLSADQAKTIRLRMAVGAVQDIDQCLSTISQSVPHQARWARLRTSGRLLLQKADHTRYSYGRLSTRYLPCRNEYRQVYTGIRLQMYGSTPYHIPCTGMHDALGLSVEPDVYKMNNGSSRPFLQQKRRTTPSFNLCFGVFHNLPTKHRGLWSMDGVPGSGINDDQFHRPVRRHLEKNFHRF